MLSVLRHCLCLFSLLVAPFALAVSIESEGRAEIINQDRAAARDAAIQDARTRALMQAGTHIAATQQTHDGVLEIDSLRVRASGQIQQVELLQEWIEGSTLHVLIRAEVDETQGCPDSQAATAYRKTLALTLFPLEHPAQANAGQLGEIQTGLPQLILQQLGHHPGFSLLNATHLNLVDQAGNAPTQRLPEGTLSNSLTGKASLDAQYLVSGVIRDMSMLVPVGPREPNILVDLYNRTDHARERQQRRLVLDLFLYDGFSGVLLDQQRYNLSGRWNRPREERTGFGTALFWQQEFGQQLRDLIVEVSRDIGQRLGCEPFAARITRTQSDQLWINAGSAQGLRRGDKLTVYRRYIQYDEQMRAYSELNPTGITLTLDQVGPSLTRGTIGRDSTAENIQRDDIVMAH